MASTPPEVACIDIGSKDGIQCYSLDDLSPPACRAAFPPGGRTGILDEGCRSNNRCTTTGGRRLQQRRLGPVRRFAACVNAPSISRLLTAELLPSNITDIVGQYDLLGASEGSLMSVTSDVTDCLSSTCRHARGSHRCYDQHCSPVRLLVNNTVPNLTAVDDCLGWLCNSRYDALPYADSDVIGVGVRRPSVLTWLLLTPLQSTRKKRKGPADKDEAGSAQKRPLDDHTEPKGTLNGRENRSLRVVLLEEFHKAQCWFAATLMVVSLTYGIYEANLLLVFMLTPISLNGVLPMVFAYFLLAFYEPVSLGVTAVTSIVYALSSVVFWSLYAQHRASDDLGAPNVYEQSMFKLSDIPACGGYSALAVCPDSFTFPLGTREIEAAGHRIHVLTPLIWSFTTVVFLILLVYQLYEFPQRKEGRPGQKVGTIRNESIRQRIGRGKRLFSLFGSSFTIWHILAVLATAAFLAGLGMQLSLLSIASSLKMMQWSNWSFEHIVAVTVGLRRWYNVST
ncbi:Uu.00g016610.m01.CDS01 [Anthostomella pinea]|uniref:Uu.00g016610.m01.CDS01 n=1 Tax=Anthostomella pinea TaxID=933095 RepID=A0AAI8VYS3_9PEZI|nr:Uu.00g016610.m01.CDS01 [Anthostomella pinea]